MKGFWRDKNIDTGVDMDLDKSVETAELAVFLFLIVPSMVLSFFAVKQGSLDFSLVAFSTIFRDLALVSLIIFFLWRNGEPFSRIGWIVKNGWHEVIWGAASWSFLF
jgi:hypothetical protein